VSAGDYYSGRQPKIAMWPLKLEVFIYLFRSRDIYDRNSSGKFDLGFSTTPSSKKLSPDDCDNDRQPEMAILDILGANLAIFGCQSLSQSLGYTFIEFVRIKNARFAVGISTLSARVPEI